MIYAIKIGKEWFIAKKATGADYGIEPRDKAFWSEKRTTAFLCPVGEEACIIKLDKE
jgi:hypothetical protein